MVPVCHVKMVPLPCQNVKIYIFFIKYTWSVHKSVLKSKSTYRVSLKYMEISLRLPCCFFRSIFCFIVQRNYKVFAFQNSTSAMSKWHLSAMLKWYLCHVKMVPLPCQNGTSVMSKWYLCHVKMVPLPCQNGTSVMSKWYLCHVKMVPLPCKNGTSAILKWYLRPFQNGFSAMSKWYQSAMSLSLIHI